MWQPPSLTLRWGPYFRAAPEDEQKLVDLVAQARDAGLITRRTAVERVARQFGIENVDEYVDALEKEDEKRDAASLEKAEMALASMSAKQKAKGAPPPPQSTDDVGE